MRTNIDIDAKLLAEAMRVTRAKTKKEAVHQALREITRTARARKAFAKLEGTGWEGNLDELRRIREF